MRKIGKLWGTVLLSASVLMMAGGAVRAADANVIGYDEANPPFMFAANGEAKGLYPVLVGEVFKKMGASVTQKAEPWARVISAIDAGTSGVGGIYKNAEREKKYDYSAPIFQEKIQVYALADKKFDFKSVDDLAGKSVGVMRGWSYGDAFDKAKAEKKITVEEVENDEINVKKLSMGRVDAILAIPQSIEPVLTKAGLASKIVALPTPLSMNDTYVAFNKSAHQAELLKKFDTTLAAMKADGSYEATVEKAMH